MKLIIAGSRSITDYDIVEETVIEWINKLRRIKRLDDSLIFGDLFTGMVTTESPSDDPADYITEIISGKADGVDTLGEEFADKYGIPVQPFPAKWDTYGKAAGGIRNYRMSQYGEALCAVWDGKSTGTSNMVAWAFVQKLFMHIKQVKVTN